MAGRQARKLARCSTLSPVLATQPRPRMYAQLSPRPSFILRPGNRRCSEGRTSEAAALPQPLGLYCPGRARDREREGRSENRRPLPSARLYLPIPQCGAHHPSCAQLGGGGLAILPDRRDFLPELPCGCSLVGKEQISEGVCAEVSPVFSIGLRFLKAKFKSLQKSSAIVKAGLQLRTAIRRGLHLSPSWQRRPDSPAPNPPLFCGGRLPGVQHN